MAEQLQRLFNFSNTSPSRSLVLQTGDYQRFTFISPSPHDHSNHYRNWADWRFAGLEPAAAESGGALYWGGGEP
jgi:hypothetical protein